MLFYLQLIFAGLAAAGAYALSSVGLIAIYKGTRVINFAQGAVGMVGTYVFAMWVNSGRNYATGIVLGLLTATALALVIYALVMHPLRRVSGLTKMIGTFGVILILIGFAQLSWGNLQISIPPIVNGTARIGSLVVTWQALISIAVALVFTAGLSLFFVTQRYGRVFEAAAHSTDSAARLGYNITAVGAVTWMLGGFAAGAAGILIVPTQGLTVTGLSLVVVSAMVGALVGGFEKIWVATAASLILGVSQALITGVFPSIAGLETALPLVVLVALLIVQADVVPAYGGSQDRPPMIPPPLIRPMVLVVVVAAELVGLFTLNSYWQGLLVEGAGFALVCLSQVVILGYGGQASLMQWPLAGVGAFATSYFWIDRGLPFVASVVLGALAGAAVALIVGIPTLRLRGIAFAVVTLTSGVVLQVLVFPLFAGGVGYTLGTASVFGHALTATGLSVFALIAIGLVSLVVFAVHRSAAGAILVAVGSSERAAQANGIRVGVVKLSAFAASGLIAALGGAVYASGLGIVQTDNFDVFTSLLILALTYVNGIGSILAATVAGFASSLIPELLTNYAHLSGAGVFNLIGGLGLTATLILHPDGALVRSRRPMRRIRHIRMSSAFTAGRPIGEVVAEARGDS